MAPGRDELGRIQVDDDALIANARGVVAAACMSVDAIMRALKCDRFAAEAFQEHAHADLNRLRHLAKSGSYAPPPTYPA